MGRSQAPVVYSAAGFIVFTRRQWIDFGTERFLFTSVAMSTAADTSAPGQLAAGVTALDVIASCN